MVGTRIPSLASRIHTRSWNIGLSPAELMFLETSARTGENVEEVFLKCARTILSKIESGAHPQPHPQSARER